MRALVVRPQDVATASLLRSVTFNPRDRWLPIPSRRAIAAVIAAVVPVAEAAARDFDVALQREFDAALATGRAIEIDFVRNNGNLQLTALERDPFFRVEGGVTFGMQRTGMPESCRQQQRLRQIGIDLVDRLAVEFAAALVLTAGEQQALGIQARTHAVGGQPGR